MKRIFSLIILASLTACTIQKDSEGTTTSEIHNPFQKGKWVIENKAPQNTCVISSGYHALDVIFTRQAAKQAPKTGKKAKKPEARIAGRVVSGRRLEPGNYIRLNIAGHYYQTVEDAFSATDSAKIIENFQSGAPAYVSWKNVQSAHTRHLVGTEIDNSGFAARYAECRKKLK